MKLRNKVTTTLFITAMLLLSGIEDLHAGFYGSVAGGGNLFKDPTSETKILGGHVSVSTGWESTYTNIGIRAVGTHYKLGDYEGIAVTDDSIALYGVLGTKLPFSEHSTLFENVGLGCAKEFVSATEQGISATASLNHGAAFLEAGSEFQISNNVALTASYTMFVDGKLLSKEAGSKSFSHGLSAGLKYNFGM